MTLEQNSECSNAPEAYSTARHQHGAARQPRHQRPTRSAEAASREERIPRAADFESALAKAYASAHDPKMATRTWREVMAEMASDGRDSTQMRCRRAMNSKAFDSIRDKNLIATTSDDLFSVMRGGMNSVNPTICAAFTTSPSILASSRGRSSPRVRGRKSFPPAVAPSRKRSTKKSSPPKPIPSAALKTTFVEFSWLPRVFFGECYL